MVKFDLISFWGLSLRTIVSTGTAPKVQQERRVFQLQGKLARHSDSCGKNVPTKKVSFAERPVSFVSSGTMAETVTEAVAVGSTSGDVSREKVVGSDSKLGTFETHTKGFGSKMMAKMGT
eukprot:UN05332